MKERCKPPQLDEQEWGQFDFSRWNLDVVAPDVVSKAIAGLTQQFFDSPEWQESVQATMPQIQQAALGVFKEEADRLRASRKVAEADFARSTATAKERTDAMRRGMAAAAAPQTPETTADAYHLSVRVTGADAALGFAGVLVEVADPRDPKAAPIVAASTDVDGNATLTVGAELAKEIDKRDTTIVVKSPSGKLLARVVDGACVRVGQVETRVLNVKESADTESLKSAAVATRASREALLESLSARAPSLVQEQKVRLAALDCRLHDVDAMVSELEKPVDLVDLLANVKPYDPPPPSAAAAPSAPGGSTSSPVSTRPAAPATPVVRSASQAPAATAVQPETHDTKPTKPAPAKTIDAAKGDTRSTKGGSGRRKK